MSAAEARPPATYYEIVRRTERRVFLFRPDREINNIFLYALAVAAKATGVVIISAVLMSNHYHIIALDVGGTRHEVHRHRRDEPPAQRPLRRSRVAAG